VLTRRPPPIRWRAVRAMEALPAEFKRDTQHKIALLPRDDRKDAGAIGFRRLGKAVDTAGVQPSGGRPSRPSRRSR